MTAPAEPTPQALSEGLAALAMQVAALRGQISLINARLDQDEGHPLDRVDELAAARLERQSVIGRVPVTMIIGQHVLHRLVRSPAVMADQCGYLATVAERSGVALHVLPEGVNMGVWGAFDIATGDSTITVRMSGIEDVTSTDRDL
jgi:hypothetical protein